MREIDNYIKKKRNNQEIWFRVWLGVQQLWYKPYYNLWLLLLFAVFLFAWSNKEWFLPKQFIPTSIKPILVYCVSGFLLLALILFILVLLKYIGLKTARKDEGALITAFTPADLRYGHPIMISCKKVKHTDVTVKEFYSVIPMRRWNEKAGDIADNMNVHLVEAISYGGKNNNNSKRIVLHTAPGVRPKDRGTLYDEEL